MIDKINGDVIDIDVSDLNTDIYAGNAGKAIIVNAAANGIEFGEAGGGDPVITVTELKI